MNIGVRVCVGVYVSHVCIYLRIYVFFIYICM